MRGLCVLVAATCRHVDARLCAVQLEELQAQVLRFRQLAKSAEGRLGFTKRQLHEVQKVRPVLHV